MNFRASIAALAVAFAMTDCISVSFAQPAPANHDEAKAGNLPIPDPLTMANGEKVTSAKVWWEKRRPELFRLFETEMYGRCPNRPAKLFFETTGQDDQALGGKAIRREVSIWFSGEKKGPRMNLLIYLPKSSASSAVPAFLGLNFKGNHAVHKDPGITLPTVWKQQKDSKVRVPELATADLRGQPQETGRWPVETILERGYALATAYYEDMDPDFDDGFQNGIQPLFYKPGQTKPDADEWGSIAAWGFGLSCALDYLETVPQIDAKKVAVLGHSRLGKTALWAGARDERFAIVISNDSGCGGAALSKRIFGETVAIINRAFPHWFCGNFKKYGDKEETLPFDQHELIALIAPRPVYVASATEDLWADPKGEFLGAKLAEPVYRLLGAEGLPAAEMPAPDQPSMGGLGYHNRTGKHDVTEYDWQQYLAFADKHFRRPAK